MVLAIDLMKKAIFQQGHAFTLLTGCKIFIRIDDPNESISSSLYYGSKELVTEYHKQGLKAFGTQVDGESGSPLNRANAHYVRPVRVSYATDNKISEDVDFETQNADETCQVTCNDHQHVKEQRANEIYDETCTSNDHHSESLNNSESSTEGHADTEAGTAEENGFVSENVDSLDIIKKEIEQLPCSLQRTDAYDSTEQSAVGDHKFIPFDGNHGDENDNQNNAGGSGAHGFVNIQSGETNAQHETFLSSSEDVYSGVNEAGNAMPGIVYQCVYCNKVFDTKPQLDRHVEIYHDESRPYICAECGETFRKIGNLKSHQKVHSGLKPYGCDICGRMFARSSHLKGHKYTHEKESPYKCQVCGSCFTNGYNLKRHMLRHGGKKQHHCSMCTLMFYRRDQLLAHERCHMKKLKR